MNTAGRITSITLVSRPASLEPYVRRTRSLRYTTPTMSSTFSPITGIRECPLRTASDVAWPAVLSSSIHTISVRGTITSRAGVSPSSNTD